MSSRRKKRRRNKTNYKIIICIVLGVLLCAGIVVAVLLGTGRLESPADIFGNAESVESTGGAGGETEQGEGQDSSVEGSENAGNNSIGTVEKAEASYERWLAAAMMVSLPFNYSDVEIQHIYYVSEHEMEDKMESEGVYMVFTSEGDTHCIYCKPLSEQRTESGTCDLYTEDLGFASYEEVDVNSISVDDYQEIDEDSLSELASQSLLVSLYEN